MRFFNNLFGSKTDNKLGVEIGKHDVIEMKDCENINEKKVHSDLQYTPEIAERKTLMIFEKTFMEKFKKIGNLNQKCPYCGHEFRSNHVGEKKCAECKKSFFVQKRVQDMGTAAFRVENKALFDLQWKVSSNTRKFMHYLPHEFDYIEKQLKKQGKKSVTKNEVMQSLLSAYAKNSLNAGYYRLYAAFMFHKAELMRAEQRFAEALEYYFYVYFLHVNGVSNDATFSSNSEINEELRERISELLAMGKLQVKKSRSLFEYAITHLNVFNPDNISLPANKVYTMLMREFKAEDAQKEEQKPMRSFVLYTKAS